jgi:hypothetical protein
MTASLEFGTEKERRRRQCQRPLTTYHPRLVWVQRGATHVPSRAADSASASDRRTRIHPASSIRTHA